MGRNESKQQSGSGKIKFRVIEFEMEGGNERIEQGLKTLAGAISRAPESMPRTIPGQRGRGTPTLGVGNASDLLDPESPDIDPDLDEEEVEEPSPSAENPPKVRQRSAPRAPKFLSNLNLVSAPESLEKFIQSKAPKDTQDKYLVITEWFKEYLATEEVTVDHIFTAYKHLGWQSQLPPDPGQPLRDLKYKKHWLDSGSAKGSYKINWSGTNTVNKMGVAPEK